MFLDFYGLREQPFGMTPDPAYLYASRTHSDALASLSFGIKDHRGFVALIAEPGMGKTTLLYQLLDEMRATARTVFVFQTQCNSRELFQYILQDLNVDAQGMGLVAMHNKLNEILFEEMLTGKRFVLVVDEAQNLDETTLETVRMLSNFETQHTKLLQIVLAGQPQLAAKLAQPRLSQLRQRIAVLTHLEPFTAEETGFYINHRLKVAGFRGDTLFDQEAIALIAQLSQGIPRNINNICYTSLMLSSNQGYAMATSEIVRQAVARLDMAPLVSEPLAVADSLDEQVAHPVAADEPIAMPVVADVPQTQLASIATADYELVRSSPQLTYNAGRQPGLGRWALRLAAVASIALLGFSIPSILHFVNSTQQKELARPSDSSNPRTSLDPATGSAATATGYDAAPQDTSTGQVLTVTAGPQQTLKDLTLRYVGHFDNDLSNQILSLNPGLKDPDHLEPGQLIRIPLPPGSIKKVNDTEEPVRASKPGSSESLFARITALLRERK